MSDDDQVEEIEWVAPFQRGAGTTDDLIIGAVDAAERLISTINVLGRALEDTVSRVEALEAAANVANSVPLEEWVQWLREAYCLSSKIPKDWTRVPGMFHELQALHAAWAVAYQANGTPLPGAHAVSWHDALDRALPRMQGFQSRAPEDPAPLLPAPGASPLG